MDRSLTIPQTVAGCDLSRAFIDVCIQSGRLTSKIENTKSGLTEWIDTLDASVLVVFEATSGCDYILMETLAARHIAYARVNPRQAREFARTLDVLAKTDRVDARYWHRWDCICRSPSPSRSCHPGSALPTFSDGANSWSKLGRQENSVVIAPAKPRYSKISTA